MFDLFTTLPSYQFEPSNPVISSNRPLFERNYFDVLNYHRNNNLSLRSDHLLVRIIESLPLLLNSTDPSMYVDMLNDQFRTMLTGFGIWSSVSKGKVLTEGFFYNKHCPELVVWDDSDFLGLSGGELPPLDKLLSYDPIKILSHPFTDCSWGIPDGRYHGPEQGTCIISINVAMLMLQYSSWVSMHEMAESDSIPTPENFLMSFPIPNALGSHLPLCFLNRIIAKYNKKPTSRFIRHYQSLTIRSLDHVVDSAISYWMDRKNGVFQYSRVPIDFPNITNATMRDVLQLPDIAMSSYVRWLMYLARCKLMSFQMDLMREFNRVDRTAISNTMIQMRMMINGGMIGIDDKEILLPYINLYKKMLNDNSWLIG